MKLVFFQSSLGKKYLMAISGCLLFVFVILHLLGNLQIFLGPNQINAYGAFLQGAPELLWPARLGLLLMVLIHIVSAVQLSAENKKARPAGYLENRYVAASYASRTMLMSGLIIAAFIVYHLLHFTVQVQAANLTGKDFTTLHDAAGRHDVYAMMVTGFSNIWVSLFYLIAIALLCMHLSHGAGSMFQSMGWKNRKYGPFLDRLAVAGSVLIFLGYASIPLAVLTGLLRLH